MTITQEIQKQLHANRQIVAASVANGRALLARGRKLLAHEFAPRAEIESLGILDTIRDDNRKLSEVIANGERVLTEIDDLIAILNIYQTGNEAGVVACDDSTPDKNVDTNPNNSGFGATNAQQQTAGNRVEKEPSLADLKDQSAAERKQRTIVVNPQGDTVAEFDSIEAGLDYILDQILG